MNRADLRARAALATVLVVVTTSAPVDADRGSRDVSVFPLTSTGLLSDQADLPGTLATELAKTLRAKLSKTDLEDAALALDCQADTESCLTTITERAGTETIVFGNVIWNDMTRKLKVVLTKFDAADGKVTRSWVLEGATTDDAVPELIGRARSFLDEVSGRARAKPTCAEDPEAPGCADPQVVVVGPDGPAPGVTTGTYALIVGGAVATAVGVGFFVSAQGIRDEVDRAPDATFAQIQDLIALENKGQLHAGLGYGLMLGGAAAVTYGIVRALRERKPGVSAASTVTPSRVEQDDNELSVTPIPGGAAVIFTARFL